MHQESSWLSLSWWVNVTVSVRKWRKTEDMAMKIKATARTNIGNIGLRETCRKVLDKVLDEVVLLWVSTNHPSVLDSWHIQRNKISHFFLEI